MNYIKFTENDCASLSSIFEELDNIEPTEKDIQSIQGKLATFLIILGQEFEILEHEVHLGNVSIEDSILNCFDTIGKLHKYQIVKRKAVKGDIVWITSGLEQTPFKERHIGRFYEVTGNEDAELREWIVPYVSVGYWCLYDDQYLVLEEIK